MSKRKDDVILLDGGMGQELRKRSEKPASPLWSAQVMLDEPHLVSAAHRDFIHAGAGIIILNNYSATPQRLTRDAGIELFEPLHRAALDAAQQARRDSGRDEVRIAGCLPPLVASYHPDQVPDDATCLRDYRRLVAVQAAEVDLFICETMSLIREARAAAMAGIESHKTVWVAFTVDDSDGTRLRSGESLATAAEAMALLGVKQLLINCSVPEAVSAGISLLKGLGLELGYGGYANGFTAAANLAPGGTVDGLTARTDLDPQGYAAHAMHWVEEGASVIGGCCEVGPAHIKALASTLNAAGYHLTRP